MRLDDEGGASAPFTSEPVGQRKRPHEHGAFDKILCVIRRVQHRQAVEQHADQDRADKGAEDIGTSQIEDGEADQRCSKTILQQ
jgi:hypothetical protein